MKVGIPRETAPRERRCAATPSSVQRLAELGFSVVVESGLGVGAGLPDALYREAGATVTEDPAEVYACPLVLKVEPPTEQEAGRLQAGGRLISFLWPAQNPDRVEQLRAGGVTAMAMDMVPRITRAQKLDALSSMANLAGYRAVIEAAHAFGRPFTGQVTAAGRMPPATVLIIGAGVAGLAALGAATGLGAVVRAFDTRPEVREQVESLGGAFVELVFEEERSGGGGYARKMSDAFLEAERALFKEQAAEVDIIITTALIPGKRAPLLLTEDVLSALKPGSVVVDLAASQGGNCALTQADELVQHEGVSIVGYTDLTSRMARQASELYASNLCHLLSDLDGATFTLDLEDVVTRNVTVTHGGEVLWPPPRIEPTRPSPKAAAPEAAPAEPPPAAATEPEPEPEVDRAAIKRGLVGLSLAGLFLALGAWAPSELLGHVTVFALACVAGWQVVWNVAPALHTPLMSVTNAVSGIIVIGAMMQLVDHQLSAASLLGAVAILVATINIAGGFLVTRRMLSMFRKG